jgi:SAM-dependent methyltransferase
VGIEPTFEELLRSYWAAQPDVAPELVERFVTGDLVGGARAAAVADQVEAERGAAVDRADVVLEVGAGTAALGAELGRRAAFVVASDVSLAWMVLARRRLADAGLDNVALVVATGDALPFADGTFDLVVAADVIEHVPDAPAFVGACHRALRAGGTFWLATPNRFSLTPEPHVRVWGVGFLPRAWAPAYVRRARGVAYDDIRTLSRGELVRLLARTGGAVDVIPPAITAPVAHTYGPVARGAIAAYNRAREVSALRRLLLVVTPLFHAVVRKRPAHG